MNLEVADELISAAVLSLKDLNLGLGTPQLS